jgi:hypothetical protein
MSERRANMASVVFKKGDVNEPKNYRGISLVSHVGKLFTGLLNKRFLKWAEQRGIEIPRE